MTEPTKEYLCIFIAPYQGAARECDVWLRCLKKSYTTTTDGHLLKFGELNGLPPPGLHRPPTNERPIIIVTLSNHSRAFDTPNDFEVWLNLQFYESSPLQPWYREYREHPNFGETLYKGLPEEQCGLK
jgi:hypothetical protein